MFKRYATLEDSATDSLFLFGAFSPHAVERRDC